LADAQAKRPRVTLRMVCVDVESAVRARVEDNGAISRDVWEIGAVRFGPDRDWVSEHESMRRFISMRPGFEVLGPRATEYAAYAVAPSVAWSEFHAFACDADIIVAYNGTALDFKLVTAALEANSLSPLVGEFVDGLYLAYCVWPEAGSY